MTVASTVSWGGSRPAVSTRPGERGADGVADARDGKDGQMIKGALIAESLRPGTTIEGIPLVIRKLYRFAPPNATPEQPPTWTVLEFEATEDQAEGLATVLTGILGAPGWYCDFASPSERFVVFPGRFFRYPRGDKAGRAEAQSYGRSFGVPEAQLDWRE